MKNLFKALAVAILMAGFSSSLMAQQDIGALILDQGIQITQGQGMHFGTMTAPSTVATVILATDNSRTKTGTFNLLAGPEHAYAGSYDLQGELGATYTITLPASATITHTDLTTTMTVNTFVCSYAGLASTLDAGTGQDNFKVGATLHMASGQKAGVYAGTYTVTCDYN